jgi:3-hydroxybutyryl-CoA dehydrogenase
VGYKKLRLSSNMKGDSLMEIERIGVVGTGRVGRQICLVAAMSGFEVWGTDISPEALGTAGAYARSYLSGRVEKGKLGQEAADAALRRLHYTPSLVEAVSYAEFVIEAVKEDLELKRAVFAKLGERACPSCVLASNSSFIVSSSLATVTRRPERVCNMHFFNPVPVMKLVEVIQGPHTSDETTRRTIELARALGKTPVLLKKECYGFVVNRIMLALEREAFRLVEEGVATPEDIDVAVESGLGHPMGPFRLADLIGVDLFYDVLLERAEEAGGGIEDLPRFIREMYESGKLGQRTGSGFYEY